MDAVTAQPRYKLIIFDFDGTLADSFPCFLGALDGAAERFGIRAIDPSEVESLRGCSAREMIARVRLPFWKLPLVARYMRNVMAERADQIGLFPGISELLGQLTERGVILAIVSSNSEANVCRILGPTDAERISIFSCGASLFGKARRFREVMKETGTPRAETLCIGDEIRDFDAASQEGIPFGAVSWGYTAAPALAKLAPAALFKTPAEVLQFIDPLGPSRGVTTSPSAHPTARVP